MRMICAEVLLFQEGLDDTSYMMQYSWHEACLNPNDLSCEDLDAGMAFHQFIV